MHFRPRRWPGTLVGAGLILALLTLDGWLAIQIAQRTPDLLSFLLGMVGLLTLPLLAAISYWLYGLLNLTYHVDRNRVLIRWAASEQIIPLGQIAQVIEGSQVPGLVHWRGVRWPGYAVGRGEAEGWGTVLSFTTEPLARQLLIVTPSRSYSISPSDQEGFLAALEARRRLGALEVLPQEERRASFLTWSLWCDRIFWWLALAGGLVNSALFAYLCWRYADLPLFLPLHFDPLGQADRIGARAELFRLPLIGLLSLSVNSVLGGLLYRRLRLAMYLLLGGALLTQVLLGVGLWALMP